MSGDTELHDKVAALRALQNVSLSWRAFQADRALERILRTPLHPLRTPARAALDLLRGQDHLLRAADSEHLLRASQNSGMDSTTLLRSANAGECESTGIVRSIVARFRKALSRS
jgi:hypothetical protein